MSISLFYIEQGSGEPLILLHGNGENGAYFSNQISFFSKRYRVIVPDTRGHGQSPRGTAPFTLAQFVEDLCSFMDEHALPKANLLGFSDGGNIALLFALRYPERVLKLVLNGANLSPSGVKASFQIPIIIGYQIASFFGRWRDEAKKHADMLALMVKEPDIRPEQLKTVAVPALVIAGTRDMIKEKHTRLLAASLPDSSLVFIPGDHFIAAKKTAAFNQALFAFLDQDY